MSTQKQRDANLRNAQLSTGPKTPEGKSKASLNALKHGFCADDVTLHDDPETAQQVAERVTRYLDHYLPQSPLEEATVHEIAFCEIRLEHLVRAETGLLNFYRQLAFQQHSFSDPAGNLFHKFDPSNHRPGDERHVANMLFGVAWRDAGPEIDRMSRYESRLRLRYEKAIKRLDTLIAARPQQSESDPLPDPDPTTLQPPSNQNELLPNEPNFGLTPIVAVSPSMDPPPVVTQSEHRQPATHDGKVHN
jgi:hypothetical protein